MYTSQTSYVVDTASLKLRSEFPLGFVSSPTSTLYTGISTDIVGTTTTSIEPIGLSLMSIDVLLDQSNFGVDANELSYLDACPSINSQMLEQRRQNLVQALTNYGIMKNASQPVDEKFAIPVVWPQGTFALMKPRTGCPTSASRWLEGWLKQTPERQSPNNEWNATHLDGSLTKTEYNFHFCVKPDASDEFSLAWPQGDYCVLKHGNCPTDFTEGYVQFDDDDTDNGNAHGGVMPDGTYGSDTRLNFCCLTAGHTTPSPCRLISHCICSRMEMDVKK
ncbi:uncharacterized protein LOC128215177 [Mya arenaria]|uniref:uncharacterized protein LOC128215177 n=1 Tax=Mya arenaria TaxID=6604 RepID=UPI0022E328B6|nr:uncharacterized protein LOC128215177 [Mya arenaria]